MEVGERKGRLRRRLSRESAVSLTESGPIAVSFLELLYAAPVVSFTLFVVLFVSCLCVTQSCCTHNGGLVSTVLWVGYLFTYLLFGLICGGS